MHRANGTASVASTSEGAGSEDSRANSYPWRPFPPRQARPGPGPHTGGYLRYHRACLLLLHALLDLPVLLIPNTLDYRVRTRTSTALVKLLSFPEHPLQPASSHTLPLSSSLPLLSPPLGCTSLQPRVLGASQTLKRWVVMARVRQSGESPAINSDSEIRHRPLRAQDI